MPDSLRHVPEGVFGNDLRAGVEGVVDVIAEGDEEVEGCGEGFFVDWFGRR